MAKPKGIEATITTVAGTKITVKGERADVAKIVGLFAAEPGEETAAQPGAPRGTRTALSGVAEKDEEGNVHLTASDLKADNAIDAAGRLVYITLLARRELVGERKTDRAVVNQVLRSYNLYDGNTRNLISNNKGLIREGRKYLSLSAPAVGTARQYVRDIQDQSVTGRWSPTRARRRRKRAKKG